MFSRAASSRATNSHNADSTVVSGGGKTNRAASQTATILYSCFLNRSTYGPGSPDPPQWYPYVRFGITNAGSRVTSDYQTVIPMNHALIQDQSQEVQDYIRRTYGYEGDTGSQYWDEHVVMITQPYLSGRGWSYSLQRMDAKTAKYYRYETLKRNLAANREVLVQVIP